MTFTTIPETTSGTVLTIANWNTWVRDNVNTGAMRPLAHTTMSSATTIDWTSISSSYEHLMIMCSAWSDYTSGNSDTTWVRLNNDSGANYENQYLGASGTAAAWIAARATSRTLGDYAGWMGSSQVQSQHFGGWAPSMVLLPHYTGTTQHKTVLLLSNYHVRNDNPDPDEDHFWLCAANIWKSTSAVNRITLQPSLGTNFLVGSTFTLYGIAGI